MTHLYKNQINSLSCMEFTLGNYTTCTCKPLVFWACLQSDNNYWQIDSDNFAQKLPRAIFWKATRVICSK